MYCAKFTYSLSVRPINVWPPHQSPPSSTTPTPSPPSSLLRGKHSQPDLIAQEENEGDFPKQKKMFLPESNHYLPLSLIFIFPAPA